MMMRMLAAGGVPMLSDEARRADASNPNGYFEFAPVKDLPSGAAPVWLDDARGKAIKIVSPLLTWLPETHDCLVLFMKRDLGEVVASQQAMLAERGEPATGDAAQLASVYAAHLEDVRRFLARRSCFRVLDVEHRGVVDEPRQWAARIAVFLERDLNISAMADAVDPRLHRQRHD